MLSDGSKLTRGLALFLKELYPARVTDSLVWARTIRGKGSPAPGVCWGPYKQGLLRAPI